MDDRAAEKVCPECAETVKEEARVCRFCGYRFDGAAASIASSPQPTAATPTGFGKREWFVIWGGASAGLMLVGAFGPWLKAFGQSVSGTDGGNDGWLVVGAAVVAGLLFFATRTTRGAGLLALIGGVIGAAVTIHDRSHVNHAIGSGGALAQALVQIGWGLNLAMVASISFAIAGLIWLLAIPSEVTAAADTALLAGTANKGTPKMRRDPDSGQWVKVYVPEEDPSAEASTTSSATP